MVSSSAQVARPINVLFIAFIAALAGILFGYDVGIISGALLYIPNSFKLDPNLQGLIVSAVPFGALVASALCGRLNDSLGRRSLLLFTGVLYMLGTLGCAFANHVEVLIIARLLLGFAVGLGSFSAPLYIAEMSGRQHRGALVTLNQLAIASGILLSYLINYAFSASEAWRWMLGLGFVPAAILFLSAMRLPRSPRWLMQKGRDQEAFSILKRLVGQEEAAIEAQEIRNTIAQEKGDASIFHPRYRRVLGLGIMVSIFTQAVGINAIIYYAPKIFLQAGMSKATTAILATTGVGVINVLFTLVAIKWLDKSGRRKLLIGGLVGISLSLIILTAAFAYGQQQTWLVYLTIGSCLLFVASQAIGTGPACWLIPSEIFPLNVRGSGMGIAVAFNWGTNVVVGYLFPIVLSRFGPVACFGAFLIIALSATVYFYHRLPETQGKSLEEIELALSKG